MWARKRFSSALSVASSSSLTIAYLPLALERQRHHPLMQFLACGRELDHALAGVGGIDRHLQVAATHEGRDGAAHRALVDADDLAARSAGPHSR
jgi:hypothetical protein